jgi:hypothetical protein
MAIWMDGEPAGSILIPNLPIAVQSGAYRPAIGALCDSSGLYSSFFTGDIDEVRLSNRACTVGYFSVRTMIIPVSSRWNLISLPGAAGDARRITLFPDATSRAFAYTDHYIVRDSLHLGAGYWVKFPEAGAITLVCVGICEMPVDVSPGWNLIGSVCDPVPVSGILTTPPGLSTSSFYGYDGRYRRMDTIQPGKGYWVKAAQAGSLFLSASAPHPGPARGLIRITRTNETPPLPPNESDENGSPVPVEYALGQNYPNPFNPATTIRYQLPAVSYVRVTVFNTLGQVVSRLVDGIEDAGFRSVEWDALSAATGIYFCRMDAV